MDIVKTFQWTLAGGLWLGGRDGLSPRQARQYFRHGMRPDRSLRSQVTAHFRRSISCRHQPHPAHPSLTHASALLRLRTPMKVVQERLGHSSFAVTADIYSLVSPDLQEQAAGLFGAALRGESGGKNGGKTGKRPQSERRAGPG